jgi:hypothetical protein
MTEALAANASRGGGPRPTRQTLLVTQHGRDVARVRGTEPRDDVLAREADVVLTAAVGVACGVKVADCVPVLVADRETGAVAAIHCGWQGTVAGVVGAGIAALRRELGHEGRLLAAIGPHEKWLPRMATSSKPPPLPTGHSVIDEPGPRPHASISERSSELASSRRHDDAIDDALPYQVDERRVFVPQRSEKKRPAFQPSWFVNEPSLARDEPARSRDGLFLGERGTAQTFLDRLSRIFLGALDVLDARPEERLDRVDPLLVAHRPGNMDEPSA